MFAGLIAGETAALPLSIAVFAGAVVSTLAFVFKSLIGGVVTASEGISAGLFAITDEIPEIAGSEINNAESIKRTAAAMVSFDKTVCVPRGPKAFPEILLVKSAPASVLPGCKSTETISATQEIKKIVYKR